MGYKNAVCRGSYALGSACGRCEKCVDQKERYQAALAVQKSFDGTARLETTIARLTAELAVAQAEAKRSHGQAERAAILLSDAMSSAEAERDAIIGAAYEAAAEDLADYPRASPDYDEWTRYDEQIEHSQNIVRALTPASAIAAYAAAIRAAKVRGMMRAADIAKGFTGSHHIAHDMAAGIFPAQSKLTEAIAAAIITAAEKETGHD